MSLVIHIYYTGEGDSAVRFAEEMMASGIAGEIRRKEGKLRYEYYYPADDPMTVLLIDEWADQAALDEHHESEIMLKIMKLREKYDLHMKVERLVTAEAGPEEDSMYIRS